MGQKFTVDIRLNHGTDGDIPIVAGSSLKGKVILQVKRRVDATKLTLQLLGKESTVVRKTKSLVGEEKVIARAITTLKDFGRHHPSKGLYTIPFDFALPSSLPSTVKFPKAGSSRAYNGRIVYFLRVEMGEFRLDREFQVESAPLPSDIVPCMAEPATHELKSFGLLNKGFLSVGASVENSRVGRGQALRVAVASRNDTTVDLHRVQVKLIELIEYKAQGEEDCLKLGLNKLKDIDLPGLDKTKASKADVRKSIRGGFEQNVASTYLPIYEDLVSGENQFDVVVPKSARDSYNGNLITISHYLKVTFFTKAMVDNPSTKIPLVIGNAKESEQESSTTRRQPHEPIATVIFEDCDDDDDMSDTDTTIEVGSRAEFMPMAAAYVLGQNGGNAHSEQRPPAPNDTILLASDRVHLYDEEEPSFDLGGRYLPPPLPVPTAPSESMLYHHNDVYRDVGDDHSVESDAAHLTPPRRPQLSTEEPPYHNRRGPTGYSPFQMYNGSSPAERDRLPSYSYDTESGMTSMNDTPQRLGAAPATPQMRPTDSQWLLERLLQELNGSIHDYEVVVSKTRETGYKELFSTLTPIEFRSIIGHVTMSYQVQVAVLLAKQLVNYSSFTCEHCAAALQKTSDYFRTNMVETLLPYCNDLDSNFPIVKEGLSDWEKITTARVFQDALR